jgi:hypothetical protein
METNFPFAPYRLEKQMLHFSEAERRLVREASGISYTAAQRLITEIKTRKTKGGDQKSK